ncbi:hypothetical protein BFS30_02200 [Pedobacter steynii]|uniref:Uncharacterized protein n=1 Tax=Pedobacter steynii TaxID=430522 RepID=A0A1D7QBM4_9SPHI|nr:hypothetical protein BFS30_02200 [Pedobacter steynii]
MDSSCNLIAYPIFANIQDMNKKLIFGVFLLFVSMINPGCKHTQMDTKQLYLKYLKSRIINSKHL